MVKTFRSMRKVRGILKTLRPHQWVKNLFVLAPVVFAKHLTHPSVIKSALGAFGMAGRRLMLGEAVGGDQD